MVGTKVDFDKIGGSAHDGEEKIYKYVQEPLRKWLANFDTVVVRPRLLHTCIAPSAHLAATKHLCNQCMRQHLRRGPLAADEHAPFSICLCSCFSNT